MDFQNYLQNMYFFFLDEYFDMELISKHECALKNHFLGRNNVISDLHSHILLTDVLTHYHIY